MGELYLCATPLGHLGDITVRALEVLKQADLIAAEDTRRTRKLLNHYGIHTPTTSYHDHNWQSKGALLLGEMEKGRKIALVTDAGTPGIADPGYRLVQQALAHGHQVTVVPGPSAAIAALVVSGISPHPFYFRGFLPRRSGARRALLRELAEERSTGVFYEAPHRLRQTLQDFVEIWGAGRRVAVARELTKQFEEVVRGTFAEVAAHFAAVPPLGELTIVAAGLEERTGGSGAAGRIAPSHAASAFLAEQEAAHAAEEGRAFEQDAKQAGGAAPHVPAGHAPGEHRETTAGDGGPLAGCGGCQASPDHTSEAVAALIKAGADTSSACKAVAKALGLSKSEVYRLYHKE